MTTDIHETINRLRELKKLATPEPWTIETSGHDYPVEVVHHSVNLQGEPDYLEVFMPAYSPAEGEYAESEEGVNIDVRYAVCLVNAAPGLLAELDRLQKSEKALKNRFARTFNKWRARRPELIRKERLEAWNEGYKYGQLSGIKTQRVGHVHPYKNPYEK